LYQLQKIIKKNFFYSSRWTSLRMSNNGISVFVRFQDRLLKHLLMKKHMK